MALDMDSVFADSTDKELGFDAMFDSDDTLIDIIAGYNEAGDPVTGPDFVYKEDTEIEDDGDNSIAVEEKEDLVGENPDFDYNKDGDAAYSLKDAEGTKEEKPELGGEVGDKKSIPANSAESKADDTKDEEEAIGMNDKQQTSLEASDVTTDVDSQPEEDNDTSTTDDATTECKESAAPEEPTSDTTPVNESTDIDFNAFFESMNAYLDKNLSESADKCPCCGQEYCDCAEREGKADHKVTDIEGQTLEIPGEAKPGNDNVDTIEDKCDTAQRQAEVKNDTKNEEGITNEPVSQEAPAKVEDGEGTDTDVHVEETVRSLLADILADTEDGLLDKLEGKADLVVPDTVDDTFEKSEVNKVEESAEEEINLDDINEDTEIELTVEASDAKEVENIDDADEDDIIDIVDDEKGESNNGEIEADYDDDELIDMVLSGKEI